MTENFGLERLRDSSLSLAKGERDLRNLTVVDPDGEEIGTVQALYVDTVERKVRFLDVRGGGLLGVGDAAWLIPVEAIHHVRDDRVRVGQSRKHIEQGPAYDPRLVTDEGYWAGLSGWYGYPPYWLGWPVTPAPRRR